MLLRRRDGETGRGADAHALLSTSLVLGTLTALVERAFFATLHGQVVSVNWTGLHLFFVLRAVNRHPVHP